MRREREGYWEKLKTPSPGHAPEIGLSLSGFRDAVRKLRRGKAPQLGERQSRAGYVAYRQMALRPEPELRGGEVFWRAAKRKAATLLAGKLETTRVLGRNRFEVFVDVLRTEAPARVVLREPAL
jgi:hypothetical protein